MPLFRALAKTSVCTYSAAFSKNTLPIPVEDGRRAGVDETNNTILNMKSNVFPSR
jgi:hypothetical protein